MKYIIGVVFTILIVGLLACGNEGGESSVLTRKQTNFGDLKMYKGAPEGAFDIRLDSVANQNRDSLFRIIVLFKYLSQFGTTIEQENQISFEFLDNNMLSFKDLSLKKQILSSYIYKEDSLFVLKGGTEEVFVAVKEKNTNNFYRTKSIVRKILKSYEAEPVDVAGELKEGLIDLDIALEFGEFESKESMTSPKDTIIWCNVKYIYGH